MPHTAVTDPDGLRRLQLHRPFPDDALLPTTLPRTMVDNEEYA